MMELLSFSCIFTVIICVHLWLNMRAARFEYLLIHIGFPDYINPYVCACARRVLYTTYSPLRM